MGKYCPYQDGKVTYLECQDCEEPICTEGFFFCLVTGSVPEFPFPSRKESDLISDTDSLDASDEDSLSIIPLDSNSHHPISRDSRNYLLGDSCCHFLGNSRFALLGNSRYIPLGDSRFHFLGNSRFHPLYSHFKAQMDRLLVNHPKVVIVADNADGAGRFAKQYAQECGFPFLLFSAKWEKEGKVAGKYQEQFTTKTNQELIAATQHSEQKIQNFLSKQKHRGIVIVECGENPETRRTIAIAKEYQNPIRRIFLHPSF